MRASGAGVGRRLIVSIVTTMCWSCVGSESPFTPSPVILPDAVVLHAGQTQTFTVQYATVRGFNLSGSDSDWRTCVQVDAGNTVENSIRIVALRACDAKIYVAADVGPGRTPLAAVMSVQ
jgi:hypothetical protein